MRIKYSEMTTQLEKVIKDKDILLKVLFIGDSGVGKSSIITRITSNKFTLQ